MTQRCEILAAPAVDHRVRLDAALHHLVEPMPYALPRFQRIESDQHVRPQMLRRDAGALQRVDSTEEYFLVAQVVPCRVQPALRELGISVLDGRERRGRRIVDQSNVNALRQTDA